MITSVYNVVFVKIFHSRKDCLYDLNSVLFGELSKLTNPVKQFTTGRPIAELIIAIVLKYQCWI
jgi:hypothetical protein